MDVLDVRGVERYLWQIKDFSSNANVTSGR